MHNVFAFQIDVCNILCDRSPKFITWEIFVNVDNCNHHNL